MAAWAHHIFKSAPAAQQCAGAEYSAGCSRPSCALQFSDASGPPSGNPPAAPPYHQQNQVIPIQINNPMQFHYQQHYLFHKTAKTPRAPPRHLRANASGNPRPRGIQNASGAYTGGMSRLSFPSAAASAERCSAWKTQASAVARSGTGVTKTSDWSHLGAKADQSAQTSPRTRPPACQPPTCTSWDPHARPRPPCVTASGEVTRATLLS